MQRKRPGERGEKKKKSGDEMELESLRLGVLVLLDQTENGIRRQNSFMKKMTSHHEVED